jgi:peptidoglycan/LPS O-acetylase OafA/YrhL
MYGVGLWVASAFGLLAYNLLDVSDLLSKIFPRSFQYARYAVEFWPKSCSLAILVALNIVGCNHAGEFFTSILTPYKKLIRETANWSFGLYLLHYPIGYLVKILSASVFDMRSVAYIISIYGVTFAATVGLAVLCERHRHRLRNWLSTGYSICVQKFLSQVPPAPASAWMGSHIAPTKMRVPSD